MQFPSAAVEDLESLQPVRTLAEHYMVDMHVSGVEAHAMTLGHDLAPRLTARGVEWRGNQSEVARAVVGEDHEAIALVVDRVLHARPPRLDHHRLGVRLVRAQVAALARHLARAAEDHEL